MAQTEAEFKAAYDAGYHAREKEWDYDPGRDMPDDVLGMPTTMRIPVFVPGFSTGHHSDLVLGTVEIYGDTAILKLQNGEDFQKRLVEGAYFGMMVRFPVDFDLQKYMKDHNIEWGSTG